MSPRHSGVAGGNRRRSSGNKTSTPHGQFKATATMSGTGTQTSAGAGTMTATAALSSTGGMLGLMGTGVLTATAALTGTGSVVASTLSFFYPSTNGPSSGTSFSSPIGFGLQFKVTAPGHTLLGYAWWVQAGTNPNPTVPQTFCLYTWVPSTWSLVAAGTIVSGTLSVGWNTVMLGSGVSLTSGQVYQACTGLTGNFNDVTNQFGSGQPYAAGITKGDLFAFSDLTGSAQSPSNINQSAYEVAGADPTLHQPTAGNASDNFFIDVIIQ